jgi:hypothetical protein
MSRQTVCVEEATPSLPTHCATLTLTSSRRGKDDDDISIFGESDTCIRRSSGGQEHEYSMFQQPRVSGIKPSDVAASPHEAAHAKQNCHVTDRSFGSTCAALWRGRKDTP